MIILILTAINTSKEMPVMATPRAVPAAGGCSISTTTMTNMATPTASEYTIMEYIKAGCGIRENKKPQKEANQLTADYISGLSGYAVRHGKHYKSCGAD